MYKMKKLLNKALYRLKIDGAINLAGHIFLFLVSPIFKYQSNFLLYKKTGTEQNEPLLKAKDSVFKVVTSVVEFDKLRHEFSVDNYLDIAEFMEHHDKRLEAGAILFCVFVGKELVCTGWAYIDQKTMSVSNSFKITVDYDNNEAYWGRVYTLPQYRGLGINPSLITGATKYLYTIGVKLLKTSILKDNVSSLRTTEKTGWSVYGEKYFVRILVWNFSREKIYRNFNE
jgi:GNAT superfamily N-acetyltransferase